MQSSETKVDLSKFSVFSDFRRIAILQARRKKTQG